MLYVSASNQIKGTFFLIEPYMCHSFKLTSVGRECRHMISAQAVFTADILTCYVWRSTYVTDINNHFTLISQ